MHKIKLTSLPQKFDDKVIGGFEISYGAAPKDKWNKYSESTKCMLLYRTDCERLIDSLVRYMYESSRSVSVDFHFF